VTIIKPLETWHLQPRYLQQAVVACWVTKLRIVFEQLFFWVQNLIQIFFSSLVFDCLWTVFCSHPH